MDVEELLRKYKEDLEISNDSKDSYQSYILGASKNILDKYVSETLSSSIDFLNLLLKLNKENRSKLLLIGYHLLSSKVKNNDTNVATKTIRNYISGYKVFMDYITLVPNLKRMDSLMVASSCKSMSRLEIIYKTIQNIYSNIYTYKQKKTNK